MVIGGVIGVLIAGARSQEGSALVAWAVGDSSSRQAQFKILTAAKIAKIPKDLGNPHSVVSAFPYYWVNPNW